MRVIIQAGHLNTKTGRTGTAGEVEYVTEMRDRIGKLLPQSIDVVLADANIPDGLSADLFLSLHCDGSANSEARGFSIGYLETHDSSERFARKLEYDYRKTGLDFRGFNYTKDQHYYYGFRRMTKSTPVSLLEFGFLTNKAERDYLYTHKDFLASIVAGTIIEFLRPGVVLEGEEDMQAQYGKEHRHMVPVDSNREAWLNIGNDEGHIIDIVVWVCFKNSADNIKFNLKTVHPYTSLQPGINIRDVVRGTYKDFTGAVMLTAKSDDNFVSSIDVLQKKG